MRPQSLTIVILGIALLSLPDAGWSQGPRRSRLGCRLRQRLVRTAAPAAAVAAQAEWRPLFDGRTLDGWEKTNFGGEREVVVQDGSLIIEMGYPMTGVTYKGPLPNKNYELRFHARRLEGVDFFVGLTFPVREEHCSLIVGGWSGGVVGLSSIDGRDASENETTTYMGFNNGEWQQFRLRVTESHIQIWINDKSVIRQNIVDRKLSLRNEVELSKPLGFATWETKAEIKNIEIRPLALPGG